jgi:TolB-like protein
VIKRAIALASFPFKSIAVLPFENLSDDKQSAYFADGVQDEILNYLAKVADLKVISRTSVMQYKTGKKRNLREIGTALGVAHVLEGSVQRAANRVRVSAQLIDARSDAHLWGERYDRPLDDVFAIQSEIAKTIAEQLQAKISPNEKTAIEKPPTRDLDAYDLYLQALGLFADSLDPARGKENLPKAVGLLNDAVARDPKFLLAWCLLARVHSVIHWWGHEHTPERLELCNQAVQTALRIQPDAGEAQLALADYYYHGFRDYGRAREELAIARRTLPNNAEVFADTAYIDRREGRWEERTRNLERSLELDPRNFFTLQGLAQFYEAQRRYGDEARILDRALTIVPGDPTIRAWRAFVALYSRADIKPFQVLFAKLISENPGIGPEIEVIAVALCERTDAAAARALANYPREGAVGFYGVNFPHAYWEGVVASWQGDRAKAKAAFAAARPEVEQPWRKTRSSPLLSAFWA